MAIGLMSGTSVDGISAVVVRIRGRGAAIKLNQIAFATYPFSQTVRALILENSAPGHGSVDQICRLNFLLGELYVDAVQGILQKAGLRADEIDFVGSHGQTVHHLPRPQEVGGKSIRATLQIGEPAVIANRLGILTVGDFRVADLAAGGEGAPLVPYFDFLMFRSEQKSRGLLNLGGIGNITVLPKACTQDQVFAFDTGPANMVVDRLMTKLFGRPYDENGAVAQQGQVSLELHAHLAPHPYLYRRPPKSTGREEFGESFVEAILEFGRRKDLPPEDLVATATEFTAFCIGESHRRYVEPEISLEEMLVSGGGVHNQALMKAIQSQLPGVVIRPSGDLGIDPDAKEALCFAVLADETLAGRAANLPRVTGAAHPVILGKICLPPPRPKV